MPTPADPDITRKLQLRLPFNSRQPDKKETYAFAGDADTRAWIAELWMLYQGLLLELAHYHLHDWDRAQEIVQDTWVDFVKSLHRFEGRCSPKTWLVQILKRCLKKERRRMILRRARETLIGVMGTGNADYYGGTVVAQGGGNPETALLMQERLEHILHAGRALPERQAEVWMLRDLFQWTSQEVSTALAISPENQRVLLHRARQRLRAELEHYFGDTSPAEARHTQSHDLQRP